MEIRRCLQLLELKECSTSDAARRAYRDLVRVWHPDRFAGDPRLQRRAEERVKQLNVAYDTLLRHLERREYVETQGQHSLSLTEAFFEAGTRRFLTIWYSLNRATRSALKEASKKEEAQKPLKRQ
ncbi:MAG: J domain-containing protein [Desulfatiglandales bacterium]